MISNNGVINCHHDRFEYAVKKIQVAMLRKDLFPVVCLLLLFFCPTNPTVGAKK